MSELKRQTSANKPASRTHEIAVVLNEHAWHCAGAVRMDFDNTERAGCSALSELEIRLDASVSVENDDIYFGPLFRGINEYMAREAVRVRYVHVPGDRFSDYAGVAEIDGLVLIAPDMGCIAEVVALSDQRKPFVVVSLAADSLDHGLLPCVDSDNCRGAASAVAHLIGLGHRRIGCINLASDFSNHIDRAAGYYQALTNACRPIDEELLLIRPGYDLERFEAEIDAWLDGLNEALPTALFVCDFKMTMAVLGVLNRRGIAIPDQMSVVCFDDPYLAERTTPPLTTVRQPVYGLGMWASQRLVEAIRAPGGPAHVMGTDLLPTRLIVRESTAPPPTSLV